MGRVDRLRGHARQWVLPLVLALLCLRALIPVGVMLAPIDGRLTLVLCDHDASGTAHPHHSGHDPATHSHHTQLDPTCPYAQSSGPAPLPALPTLGREPSAPGLVRAERTEQRRTPFGPARWHSPRAPPILA